MALRAGYYGVKRWLWDKLQSVPAKVDGLIENINITGVKNFLIPLTSTYDNNGVVISPVSNGIKINGTTTAEVNYDYIPVGSSLSNLRGKFKLSLGVDSISGMNLVFYKSTSGSWNLSGTTKEIEVNLTDAEHLSGKVRIYIANDKTYSNVVISPMITLLSDPDESYEPYAMTNQELTELAIILKYKVLYVDEPETVNTNKDISLDNLLGGNKTYFVVAALFQHATNNGYYSLLASEGNATIAYNNSLRLNVASSNFIGKKAKVLIAYSNETFVVDNRDAAPEERSLEVEEPVVVKKTTRKKTTKTEEEV